MMKYQNATNKMTVCYEMDGRTDGRIVGHWYTIIRPVLKTGV
jgi:hypothetical protein